MADITMCTSDDCPVKDNCYRHLAKPSQIQSYSNFEYTCNEESGFNDFIKIERR